jgi:ankyrin repeat protein
MDLNTENAIQQTPILLACWEGHDDVVKMLLYHRVDMNKPDDENTTPLWLASLNGHIKCIELLMAHDGIRQKLDVTTRSHSSMYSDYAKPIPIFCIIEIEELFNEYKFNPINTKWRLRLRHRFHLDFESARYFLFVVLLSDGYFTLKEQEENNDTTRYFSIMLRLPMKLQMLVCNRLFGLPQNIILASIINVVLKEMFLK